MKKKIHISYTTLIKKKFICFPKNKDLQKLKLFQIVPKDYDRTKMNRFKASRVFFITLNCSNLQLLETSTVIVNPKMYRW